MELDAIDIDLVYIYAWCLVLDGLVYWTGVRKEQKMNTFCYIQVLVGIRPFYRFNIIV